MKLIEWRTAQGLTQAEVAKLIAVAAPTISSWECGGKKPGAKSVQRIFDISNGAVTPNDFYDLPEGVGAAVRGSANLSNA